jgi:hypothetical protein
MSAQLGGITFLPPYTSNPWSDHAGIGQRRSKIIQAANCCCRRGIDPQLPLIFDCHLESFGPGEYQLPFFGEWKSAAIRYREPIHKTSIYYSDSHRLRYSSFDCRQSKQRASASFRGWKHDLPSHVSIHGIIRLSPSWQYGFASCTISHRTIDWMATHWSGIVPAQRNEPSHSLWQQRKAQSDLSNVRFEHARELRGIEEGYFFRASFKLMIAPRSVSKIGKLGLA